MSRTFKDRPYKIKYPQDWHTDRVRVEGNEHHWHYYIDLPTTKTKKRKGQDVEEHWMTTPGWWINIMMERPQRRASKLWENNFRNKRICTWHESYIDDTIDWLESFDTPSISRKPHCYFW